MRHQFYAISGEINYIRGVCEMIALDGIYMVIVQRNGMEITGSEISEMGT